MSRSHYNAARAARGLSRWQKPVLEVLADRSDAEGRCWPPMADVAAKVGASEVTVRRAIQALEAAGLVAIQHRHNPSGSRRSNVYTVFPNGLPGGLDA